VKSEIDKEPKYIFFFKIALNELTKNNIFHFILERKQSEIQDMKCCKAGYIKNYLSYLITMDEEKSNIYLIRTHEDIKNESHNKKQF
jgi:hypothetical protein